ERALVVGEIERGGIGEVGAVERADRRYKVAGWAAVSAEARRTAGRPVWDVLADWLRDQHEVTARPLNTPRIVGVAGNPGIDTERG
ncbi:hypothetical protein ACQUWY_14165, partial [Ralstonia pseudosolanacearum]